MIVIDNTIISDDLLDKQFVCALDKCKGACCVAGDSGAPLELEETEIIEKIYDSVKPYMTQDGIDSVEKFGKWLIDSDGDFVTPLVNGVKQCAYVYFENDMAKCAIEKAYEDGKVGKAHTPGPCQMGRTVARTTFRRANPRLFSERRLPSRASGGIHESSAESHRRLELIVIFDFRCRFEDVGRATSGSKK